MVYPTEAPCFLQVAQIPAQPGPVLVFNPQSAIRNPQLYAGKHFRSGRGLYHVFNDVGYWIYYGTSIPTDDDDPQETNASLPYTTTGTFSGTGTWYIGVKYFNGVVLSPFKPIGPNGEHYLRLDLASGVEKGNPPSPPLDVFVHAIAAGKTRVEAVYAEISSNRGDTFCIAYTTDGSSPAVDTPDHTVTINASGKAILTDGSEVGYDIDTSAQAHGTTIKVRVQIRRDDNPGGAPDYIYSDTSDADIQTITTDKTGPGAPAQAEAFTGAIPEIL